MSDQPRDMDGKFVARPKGTKKKTGIMVWILRIIFLPIWLLYEITKWGIRSIKAGGSKRIVGIVGLGTAWLIFLILFISVLSGGGGSADQPTASVLPTATTQAIAADPTNTPVPTEPPLPTDTPAPTNTPEPTNTPTQPPPPQVYSGSGDTVEIVTPVGAAIMDIEYTGGRNFIIENFDSAGNQIDLLVNTIGAYTGRIELDFMAAEETSMLQIQASGPWTITITPLLDADLKTVAVGSTYTGRGDEVIRVDGSPKTGTFANPGERNFIVYSIGDSKDLLINEIAPYTGTVIVPKGTILLIIKAVGDWSIDLQ